MLYANTRDNDKVEAFPDGEGFCPECRRPLRAKCGDVIVWHWAHIAQSECPHGAGETAWHLGWKSLVRKEHCEVKLGEHRADIVGNGGLVVELQNSPITAWEIRKREEHYKSMVWVFNAEGYSDNIDLRVRNGYISFRWKWPRQYQTEVRAPLFWDFGHAMKARDSVGREVRGNHMFLVKKLYGTGGYGEFVDKRWFKQTFLSEVLKPR